MPSRPSLCPAAGVVPVSSELPIDAAQIDGTDSIIIAPLPDLPEPPSGSGWAAFLPALGGIGMSAYAVLSGRLLVILLSIAGSAVAVLVALATRRAAVRRWRDTYEGRRSRYLDHLATCRTRATAAAQRQRSSAAQRCPSPAETPRAMTIGGSEVRLGIGRVALHPPLRSPTPPHPSALPWPELAAALTDLVTEVATVDDCPVTIDLAAHGPLGLVGSASKSRALTRAISVHSPEVRVVDVPGTGAAQSLTRSTLSTTDSPAVVIAETLECLPPEVRTVGVWNADGSLTLHPSTAGAAGGRRLVVARPDLLTEEAADRLTGRLNSPPPGSRARDVESLPPLGVVLGTTETGEPVVLDLAESARGGDGPHGWVVGATGTGKSQLLRRLVVGLAAGRSPDDVAFVLVDFKGGAAFDDLAALPHVAGVLTNLDDSREQGDAHRLISALQAEVRRRQRALRVAGVPDLTTYRSDQRLDPEPDLVVVVDEAAELLGSCPEVLDTFATIGRVGRSLGIHLVLAAQRPEEARLRSLEGALRFRICLRTLTTADSVAVVRDPGAATLPAAPGWALLAVDAAPQQFRVTPVNAVPATTSAERARPVWHPPLPSIAPMPVPAMPDEPAAALEVRLGLGDAPQTQWQGWVSLALEGSAGHLAVVGAPRTGRTSTLRTIAVDLAATVAPSRLHLYAVSADPELHGLGGLPHTGAVAHPADHDLVLDVVSTVATLVSSRQHLNGDRVRPLHRPADVVLLIDDWPHLRAALPDLEPLVQAIAVAGLAVGIHLLLSAHRWSDLRAALRDCLGSRIELHLPDPLESLLPRTLPGPPPGRPGRGVLLVGQLTTAAGEAALPMRLQVGTLGPDAETEVRHRWSTHPAPVPRIQPLPSHAIRPAGPSPDLTLGVGSAGPVTLDLDTTDRHLLIVGEPGSGRSTLLGSLTSALNAADCWLVDPRGSLRAAGIAGHRAGRTPVEIEALLIDLHQELMATLDGERHGRRTALLVDDLDIAASLTSPGGWSAIAALLPLAADLKFTVVVTRRCAGMARAAYDPFLTAIREAGATGLLLDGSPDEGPIVGGVRCRPSPTGRALLVRPGQPPRALQLYAGLPAISQRVSSF